MSTPTQYPRTNIVKLNPPSTTTRDNTAVDGVSFLFNRDFYRILHRICPSISIDNVFFS
jgi:hypothetical protein